MTKSMLKLDILSSFGTIDQCKVIRENRKKKATLMALVFVYNQLDMTN